MKHENGTHSVEQTDADTHNTPHVTDVEHAGNLWERIFEKLLLRGENVTIGLFKCEINLVCVFIFGYEMAATDSAYNIALSRICIICLFKLKYYAP